MSNIDSTSIIYNNARIGKNVTIKEFVIIHDNATIGDNTIIDSHTIITGDTMIGNNNHIFSHSVIGSIPQDLKYRGEKVKLVIGDNNVIREFVSISPGTKNGGGVTKIGCDNLIMCNVHIGHDVTIGNSCVLSSYSALAGHVTIKNNVVIGGKASVYQFVNIGSFAMIAGGGLVRQDIPPFCLAIGVSTRIHSINTIGLKRHENFNVEDIEELKRLYKKLFTNPFETIKLISQKILDSNNSSNNELEMAKFILTKSKRGIAVRCKNNHE